MTQRSKGKLQGLRAFKDHCVVVVFKKKKHLKAVRHLCSYLQLINSLLVENTFFFLSFAGEKGQPMRLNPLESPQTYQKINACKVQEFVLMTWGQRANSQGQLSWHKQMRPFAKNIYWQA